VRIYIALFLAFFLASCETEQTAAVLQGYVEGRQLTLAPRSAGLLTILNVAEGDQVAAGDILFSIDGERAQARLDEAKTAKQASEARLADLKKGGRPAEIQAAQQTLKETQASLTLAEQTFQRSKDLVSSGNAALARLDQDRANLDAVRARFTEAKARLALIQLPARSDLILAAERDVQGRSAAIVLAEADLLDRSMMAPVAGRIETIYRRVGEVAGPSQPVLALLPPDQKRIRFFVPEPMLANIQHGNNVILTCDNCPFGLQGKITFISDQAEFTPPVIFTEKERAKLVYMVEALPNKPEAFLVGMPVGVTLQ